MRSGASVWLHVYRAGQLEASLPVEDRELVVGSRAFCDVHLQGKGIRPEHARVRREPDGRVIYVPADGQPPRVLVPGTHHAVGEQTLVVELRAGSGTELESWMGEVVGLATALVANADPAAVFQSLLAKLLATFRAEWAAVLGPPVPGEPPAILHSTGARPGGPSAAISRSVLEQVVSSGEAVLLADVRGDEKFGSALSIPVEVRSVIAAPLGAGSRLLGVAYLESPVTSPAYTASQRNLLGLVCRLAADLIGGMKEGRAAQEARARLEALHRTEVTREHDVTRLVGKSPAMTEVLEQVHDVARTDVTTLLLGETGTGKELVAKAIHAGSARAAGPFVAVNCMALPAELVEGELFGHARGAFSGAVQERMGRFEMAHGGTLFLDEVGELSTAIQVKLLRVLQERRIQRLGEGREREIDVRLVAATNADLPALIAKRTFREDLYYRLSVFVVRLPPLRARREDLPLLVEHFCATFNRRRHALIRGVDPAALAILEQHAWPGNVRELRNVIEQAFVRERGEWITPRSLSLTSVAPRAEMAESLPEGLQASVAHFERVRITRALELERGNVPRAAARLELTRGGLYKKCAQHGIDPAAFRR